MNLLSLPAGGAHSLNCPADYLPSVSVTLSSGCGSLGKAIDQRWCVVDREADSDGEYYDASPDVGCSDDDYFDALDCLPAGCQKGPARLAENTDSFWNWVKSRKS